MGGKTAPIIIDILLCGIIQIDSFLFLEQTKKYTKAINEHTMSVSVSVSASVSVNVSVSVFFAFFPFFRSC